MTLIGKQMVQWGFCPFQGQCLIAGLWRGFKLVQISLVYLHHDVRQWGQDVVRSLGVEKVAGRLKVRKLLRLHLESRARKSTWFQTLNGTFNLPVHDSPDPAALDVVRLSVKQAPEKVFRLLVWRIISGLRVAFKVLARSPREFVSAARLSDFDIGFKFQRQKMGLESKLI